MPKVAIAQFHKGITDFIYKATESHSETCDNLFITKNFGLKTRHGSDVYSSSYPRVTTNDRITKLFEFNGEIIVRSLDKLYSLNSSSGFTEIQGDSRSIIYNHSSEEYIDHDILNGQVLITSTEKKFPPLMVYYDTTYEAVTAGLPELATTPTVAPAAPGTTYSYIYAFVYYRTYTSNALTFEEYGTPTYLTVTGNTAIGSSVTYAISGIPNLTNASGKTFWKTGTGADDMKVKVFRTTNNGSVFYDTGISVDNGTTTASDNVADNTLINNNLLYTEGGIAENDDPPTAKYVTVAKDAAFYCNTSLYPNRIRQSKRLQPGACPDSYYLDVEDDITGVGTSRDYPIVFTKYKVYRIEGFIDEVGRGDLQKRVIPDRVGCINHRTIVQTRQGIYFASSDGWYFTDGFSIKELSQQIKDRYQDLVINDSYVSRMVGAYYNKEKKVFFSVQNSADNDQIYVYDEVFDAWTTITGQTDFIPTALGTFDNQMLRADDEGYVYKYDSDLSVDKVREVGVAATSWGDEAIVYTFKHMALNFGSYDTKKWVNKVTLQVKDGTGQHIDVKAYDEDATIPVDLKPVTSVGLLPWGEAGFAWGESGLFWKRSYIVSKTRRFPAGSLRTRFKQLYLTNQTDAVIQYSDASGDATVNATAKTITLDASGAKWDAKIVNYKIRLARSVGGYNTEFTISSRDSDTQITVLDSAGNLVDGSQEWEVIGIKKNEVLDLQAITYTYTPLSDRGGYYKSSEAEGND